MFFIKGLIIGLAVAAPVGPIGVLCIQRTLAKGKLSGFVSGLGAACADAIYGLVAGFGLAFISRFLVEQQFYLRLFGGLFLVFLAFKIWQQKPVSQNQDGGSRKQLFKDYGSTLFLTLTNPATILSFVAIFAGLGVGTSQAADYISASILVLGVFLGSALWWLILALGVGIAGKRIHQELLMKINKISALIMLLFGLVALVSVVEML